MSAYGSSPSRPSVHSRRTFAAVLCAVVGAGTALTAMPAAHAAGAFGAGDLVVYRVGAGSTALSSSATPVFFDEYAPTGSMVQSVALPTAASGTNKPLTASGTATSEGMITLSPNSKFLAATGYDAAVGTSKVGSTSAAATPRTVAIVNASAGIDTSTALTDLADTNNVRSAVTTDGTNIWVGGASSAKAVPADGPAVRFATDGASTSTAVVNAADTNVRGVSVVDGQLYTSADPTKAGAITIATVGTGLPTSGSATPANLPGLPASNFDPYAYSLLTLGNGSTPDTIYVADNTAGAIDKFSLSGGSWVADGSVSLPGAIGVTANDNAGVVSVFATTSNSAGTSGTLATFTDSSGLGGTLTGTAATIATAPANEAFRGVAFAPGTVIGSGGGIKPPPAVPTIAVAHTGLPAALGDPTNPTLGITVGDPNFTADQLSVTASSSNTSVAPQSGISVTGTGASRTLTVTPGGSVGYSTITLTVTAPDSTSTTTSITYAVSANLGDPSDRYFSGAGNASSAIDVGGGYMLVGDDESNVIRLYNETQSGPPVKTFDFTSQLPFGTTEIDIEASARSGNTLYWTGSMSTNSSGNVAPARSTLFAATISGSGANTTLTYLGSYTGLQSDFVNWDENNGSGLGANYFGFNNSVNGGIDSHEINAFNVEGMEFAGSSSTTAYVAFRAPLEPTSDRHLALVIPVTNINQLVANGNPGNVHATFGAPMLWNLGGLGVREIRENADGQYLISAGTADDTNSSFVLYSWDGNPSDPPVQTNTALPLIPAGANQGSWETIVSVPDPLTAGAPVQLIEDNGDTAWYGDDATSKDTLPADLQKDLGRVFTYSPPSPNTVTIKADSQTITFGSADPAFTFTSSGLSGSDSLSTPPSCGVAGAHTAVGTYQITCSGAATTNPNGNDSINYVAGVLTVTKSPVVVSESADNNPAITGQPVTFTATVSAPGVSAVPSGTVEFSSGGTDLVGCGAVPLGASAGATCSVAGGFVPGAYPVVASYSGDGNFNAGDNSAAPLDEIVGSAATSTSLSADNDPATTGEPVTLTATVAVLSPGTSGAGTPTGTVEFSFGGSDIAGCNAVEIDATGTAQCSVPNGFSAGTDHIVAIYSGDSSFAGSDNTASPLVEQVNQADTATGLTADNNPLVTGQPVTLTATVTVDAPGSTTPVTPGGTVDFRAGGSDLSGCAAVPVDPTGTAMCVDSAGFAPSTQTISAVYSGDANFVGSSAANLVETVTSDATVTTVTASANPPVTGQPVDYIASVAPVGPGSGTPTGTVTFTVTGPKKPALTCSAGNTVALSNGVASCLIPANKLTVGATYSVDVSYTGDGSFTTSTGSLQQTIAQGATNVTVTSSANPSASGAAVTFQASVAANSPAAGNPTGTVTFAITGSDGSIVTCKNADTVKVASGKCVVAAGMFSVAGAPYTVSASYSGSANFTPSTGIVSQNVAKAPTTTKLQSSAAKTKAGQPVTFTATVKPTPAGRAPLAGSVTFVVTGLNGDTVACPSSGAGSTTPSGGSEFVATCTVPAGVLQASDGPYQVVASYSGDANDTASSASTTHTVTAVKTR